MTSPRRLVYHTISFLFSLFFFFLFPPFFSSDRVLNNTERRIFGNNKIEQEGTGPKFNGQPSWETELLLTYNKTKGGWREVGNVRKPVSLLLSLLVPGNWFSSLIKRHPHRDTHARHPVQTSLFSRGAEV